MRIYTPAGDLSFRIFTFPDGQPHFKLETYEREFGHVSIELALRNPSDLFMLMLANAVLRQHGYANVHVDIRYLMGARMDRAISAMEPFSLAIIAAMINSCGFTRVRLLDVHSETSTRLIRNSINLLPFQVVEQVISTCSPDYVVVPDKGAIERTTSLRAGKDLIFCTKKRDMATGALEGFEVDKSEGKGRCYDPFTCLIIDDICDGGGTFIGLAKELRKKGAKKVFLYVTHNVQGRDRLEGIDRIFTTDSYSAANSHWVYSGPDGVRGLTVVPISMEKLR